MLRLVSLHFLVRREKVVRWAFWRRRRARVFAWLRADSVEEARQLAEAEMRRRGWRIVRIENARREPDEAHPDVFVRQYQRIATRWGSCYMISGASEEDLAEAGSGPPGAIRSRYAPADGPGGFNDCTADPAGNVYGQRQLIGATAPIRFPLALGGGHRVAPGRIRTSAPAAPLG